MRVQLASGETVSQEHGVKLAEPAARLAREAGRSYWCMIPFSHDHAAISTLFRTPSFYCMRVRWGMTVLSEMKSSAAISWLVRPLAMLRAMSSSRSESSFTALVAAGP